MGILLNYKWQAIGNNVLIKTNAEGCNNRRVEKKDRIF